MMAPETPAQRQALRRYRLLLALLSPLLMLYTLWQALREWRATTGDDTHLAWRFLRERLGWYRGDAPVAPLWLHAASVGELNAALPLLAALRRQYPQRPLLITTATPSSARLAAQRLPPGVVHAFLPLDGAGAVHRFLRHYRPCCGLIMETELWPNLFAAGTAQEVPLVIVNGRLSLRTLNAPHFLRRQYRCALQRVSAVLARSESDRAGFIALGTPAERVQLIGNLKFSANTPASATVIPLPRPYVLAASTRDGEEPLVWQAWQHSPRDEHLLVMVPRHPRRLGEILKALPLPREQIAVRSAGETVTPHTRLYLADTFGELTGFMAGAELVFMGGSLVPKGGQNVLEPAQLGRALLFGPHMDNFADEARLLLEHEGAMQAKDIGGLATAFGELLANADRREAMGARAQAAVARHRDMAERYVAALAGFCPP